MRLRCTRTHRFRTWRSSRHSTLACAGVRVPLTANAVPALARRLSVVSVMLGTTLIDTGADSSRGRVPSPPNTARTWPLAGSVMLVAQEPSGPALVVPIWVQALPAVVYSTPSTAPAGEEPSAKRSCPDTLTGCAPFWLAALTVMPEAANA